VDEPAGGVGSGSGSGSGGATAGPPAASAKRRTRGSSWRYGAAQIRAEHLQSKPADSTVVYIGWRYVH